MNETLKLTYEMGSRVQVKCMFLVLHLRFFSLVVTVICVKVDDYCSPDHVSVTILSVLCELIY